MQILDSVAALETPVPRPIRQVLELRRSLIDLATFIIVEPLDTLAMVEAAIGFPIANDYPPWEWVLDHGGAFEAPVILSDDGSGAVLIVPDEEGIDPTLLSLLRGQAEPATAAES